MDNKKVSVTELNKTTGTWRVDRYIPNGKIEEQAAFELDDLKGIVKEIKIETNNRSIILKYE